MLAIRKKMALPRKVSHLLAGIALVDSVFLFGYAAFTHSPSSNPAVYLIPILAWVAALLLQKLAPAT